MALLGFDGFDHYNAKADLLARSGFIQYQQPQVNASPVSFVTGRDGIGKALELDANVSFTYAVFAQRVATAGVGFSYVGTPGSDGTGGQFILEDTVGSAIQVVVFFNPANYSIQIYRGNNGDSWGGPADGVLLYASANNVWRGQVNNFIEIWATIDGTAGSVEVHVNDTQLALVSGVNTQQSANAWWDRLGWRGIVVSGSANIVIDDFYYADGTSGPGTFPCNTFLGDCACRTLFGTGNASVQWTPLANSNWQEISEVVMDSDASYNSSATAGQEDLFNMQALTASIVVIYGLQVTGAYRKDDAGSRIVKQAVRPAATVYYGANNALADTLYGYFTDLWILNPETGANWTRSDVNSSAFGYNLVS